ncbi:MAG: o-succinylbenzoate--CoA ligase [Spirochaetes bacterium GWB1_36_13]|nr:MAG: o-succinylbenzoate--CoA ligase [Spirochaetes bacterium GWB1_36_13]
MPSWLLDRIESYGELPCIFYQDKSYSYKELTEEIKNNISFLEKNQIKKEETVAILGDYAFKTIALFFALFENKNIIVPITSKAQIEIEERINEAYVETIIKYDKEQLICKKLTTNKPKHEFLVSLNQKNHSGLILFSSGSTGKPKAMLQDLDILTEVFQDRTKRTSNMLVFLMFDHIGGLNTLFNALSMGASITIPENRKADYICALIEKHKVNLLPASPTFLNLLLISEAHNKYDLSSLKVITYGTEVMPESLLKRLKNTLPRVKLIQTFGTSETGITKVTSQSSENTFIKIDDPNTEYKIVEGELWLKSKTRMIGYLNHEMDNVTDDGWYKTGDLVETAENGFIKIIGRVKEVINVGGEKVLPAEVESILLQIPQISDCMVYGERNPITGQIVVADLVLKDGVESGKIKKEVRNFCKEKMDTYKIPVKINVVDKTNFSERFKKIRRKT